MLGRSFPNFPGNFGTIFFKYLALNFWEISFTRNCPRNLEGALGVKFVGNFVHTEFPDKFGRGALGLSCEIFRKFRDPKFCGSTISASRQQQSRAAAKSGSGKRSKTQQQKVAQQRRRMAEQQQRSNKVAAKQQQSSSKAAAKQQQSRSKAKAEQ